MTPSDRERCDTQRLLEAEERKYVELARAGPLLVVSGEISKEVLFERERDAKERLRSVYHLHHRIKMPANYLRIIVERSAKK